MIHTVWSVCYDIFVKMMINRVGRDKNMTRSISHFGCFPHENPWNFEMTQYSNLSVSLWLRSKFPSRVKILRWLTYFISKSLNWLKFRREIGFKATMVQRSSWMIFAYFVKLRCSLSFISNFRSDKNDVRIKFYIHVK